MNLPEDKTIIFFDGVCNFCNGWVNFILKRDKKNKFLFAPLQSEAGNEFLNLHRLHGSGFDSVIVFREGKVYKKSAAALQVASQLGFPWILFSIFKILPSFFCDFFYDFIATHRYRFFGKKEVCMIPAAELRAKFLE
jgi:predicted DCC family thiol-disulfide oxidoreductase YuxK